MAAKSLALREPSGPISSAEMRGTVMPSFAFWALALSWALVVWMHDHIGSHVIAVVQDNRVKLNPVLFGIISVYHRLFFVPWLILVFYGFKTVWWHAVLLWPVASALRKARRRLGQTRSRLG